ncbi:MAG: TIGR02444 family protein [Rhodospirillaceae bacterium]|nr:TIGR02444 family protein [Rhodospirillaceae bacterium]
MSGNPFWDFSLAVYAVDGVSDACLRLQDKRGFDVNLLLFSCWVGLSRNTALSEADWLDLIESTQMWRDEVIGPLRSARRALKTARLEGAANDHDELRRAVQRIELDCERAQQDFLASKVAAPSAPGGGAAGDRAFGNLKTLTAAMGLSLDDSDHINLQHILTAAATI